MYCFDCSSNYINESIDFEMRDSAANGGSASTTFRTETITNYRRGLSGENIKVL